MLIGLAMAGVGLATLTTISQTSSFVTSVLLGEILMSIGFALLLVPLSNLALTGVNPDDAGVASAVLNSTQQIGGSRHRAAEHVLCECRRVLPRVASPARCHRSTRSPRSMAITSRSGSGSG